MPLRVGLVGARRAREGTGPWVARFLEEAGARVVAVAGASEAGAAVAARDLMVTLGHPIVAAPSVPALLAGSLDALAICAPMPTHLDLVEAAAARGLHVLCEKPVAWGGDGPDLDRLAQAEAALRVRGRVLAANAQWPWTLADFEALAPGVCLGGVRDFAMHLAPSRPGLDGLCESLPHPASLLAALGCDGGIGDLMVWMALDGRRVELSFQALRAGGAPVAARVELEVEAGQPRTAWYALDGVRMTRTVTLDPYAIGFGVGDRWRPAVDPMRSCVAAFVARCGRAQGAVEGSILPAERLAVAVWRGVSEGRMAP
jgi:hypothetical protein